MGITVTFNSFDEMVAFAKQLVGPQPAKGQVKQKAPVEKVKTNAVTGETKIEAEVPVEEEGAKTYTLEEVRATLAKLTRSGKQKEVKAMLTSFGAKNLSGVDAKDYAALMEKAGAI